VGFLDPKKKDDDELPGASGLHLDLDTKVCPACRRECLPWQTTCPDCGETAVAPTELPAERAPLDLSHLALDDDDDGETDGEGAPDDRDT
jgi:rRNA maturation protein Nop10